MSKSRSPANKGKKREKLAQPKNWLIWPVSAVLLIVPLVMCFYPVQLDIDTYRLIGLEWSADFFETIPNFV